MSSHFGAQGKMSDVLGICIIIHACGEAFAPWPEGTRVHETITEVSTYKLQLIGSVDLL